MRYCLCLIAAIGLVLGTGCREKEYLLTGETMGTTYHIRVVTQKEPQPLKRKIDQRLKAINQSMSTYDPQSEISRFNALTDTTERFYISEDFLKVLIVAESLHRITEGAWDGTVDPLVTLWGFGRGKESNAIPSAGAIEAALARVGFDGIAIGGEGYLRKKNPRLTLDLASVAKGYGVDQIAELLEEADMENFLVEIGGEVYASGTHADGSPWKVGINTPKPNAPRDAVYQVVHLRERAFATSGDYRRYFEKAGRRYSHILDPRTGYPVDNGVVSVSVTADTCTFADGLATAVMVMGHEKGLALINRLENVESLIVVADDQGRLRNYYSKGFPGQRGSEQRGSEQP